MAYKNPLEVNDKMFKVKAENLLYNKHGYSIALSKYKDNKNHSIGIRWNDSNNGKGFPTRYWGQPAWTIIPDNLVIPVLDALSKLEDEKDAADHKKILDAIETIKNE